MDIGNINNNLNISYDQSLQTGNDLTSKLNLPSQQNNKIKHDNLQSQFKEVSKKEEAQETQKTISEVSIRNENQAVQTKNTQADIMKNVQQLIQKPETQTITALKANIAELLQDTQLNKLKQQNKDQQSNLQNKLLGEEKGSSLRNLTLFSTMALFKGWFKKVQSKPGSEDGVEETEETEDSILSENETGQTSNPQKANQIKNSSLAKQQKLFSLNMQASIRYLKNLKTFNQKYSPEMLIYDEETGYVDAKETLECLGWDEIEQFKTKLNNELNLNKLKEIHNNNKILDAAGTSGINVYKANHPLHKNKRVTLAVESLTGEIIMIDQLQDLEKLELQGKIYKIYNVAS
ncbi:MAG: hypothetical protein WCH76_00070 [Candidatus Riflemargulisbacteria bacterium]